MWENPYIGMSYSKTNVTFVAFLIYLLLHRDFLTDLCYNIIISCFSTFINPFKFFSFLVIACSYLICLCDCCIRWVSLYTTVMWSHNCMLHDPEKGMADIHFICSFIELRVKTYGQNGCYQATYLCCHAQSQCLVDHNYVVNSINSQWPFWISCLLAIDVQWNLRYLGPILD